MDEIFKYYYLSFDYFTKRLVVGEQTLHCVEVVQTCARCDDADVALLVIKFDTLT
jgi:hypothetical protein